MPHRIYDTAIAFWFGMTSSIGSIMLQVNYTEFINLAPWKLLMTLCVGVLGGVAGVLGKELVYYVKRKLKKNE